MLKRLLALFCKKKPAQKSFEEKLERLAEKPSLQRTSDEPRPRRPAGSPGYQPKPFIGKVQPPPKRFDVPARRGLTVDQNSYRPDDMIMAMAVHQTYVSPSRSDSDDCRVTHHSTSHGGYDSSPSDGGSNDGGGGSCD